MTSSTYRRSCLYSPVLAFFSTWVVWQKYASISSCLITNPLQLPLPWSSWFPRGHVYFLACSPRTISNFNFLSYKLSLILRNIQNPSPLFRLHRVHKQDLQCKIWIMLPMLLLSSPPPTCNAWPTTAINKASPINPHDAGACQHC